MPKGPFMAIASAFSIGRPSDDFDAFDSTSLSLPPDESECTTLAGKGLCHAGMPFLRVEWLTPLYCRQVLMAASRTATLWAALVRCSLNFMDSSARNFNSSSLKLDGSQCAKATSSRSLRSTRSMARAEMLSTNFVSRAI